MPINVNTYDKTPQEFFQGLSKPDYNYKITIAGKPFSVREQEKLGRVARFFGFMLSPEAPLTKLAVAENLALMVAKYEEQIGLPASNCNVDEMAKNLVRMSSRIVRNIADPAITAKIQSKFSEAITTLTRAKIAKSKAAFDNLVRHYAQERCELDPNKQLAPETFYNSFANRGWLGKFNSRVHIINKNGRFEIYTSPKLSFSQKLLGTGQKVRVEERVATVKNLAMMILADRNFIRAKTFNVDGMIQNIEGMKGRITRNIAPAHADMIRKELNTAIDLLKEDRAAIAEAQSKYLTNVVGRLVRDWILIPLHIRTTKPIGQWAWRWTGGLAIDATIAAKNSALRKFKQLNPWG